MRRIDFGGHGIINHFEPGDTLLSFGNLYELNI